MNVGGMRRVS